MDGRVYPWGDHFVEGLANVTGATPGTPGLSPVGAFPEDRSVYGLMDCAGNVRAWCANVYRRGYELEDGARLDVAPSCGADEPGLRVVRGGSFASQPHVARLASRFASKGELTFAGVGFHVLAPGPAR